MVVVVVVTLNTFTYMGYSLTTTMTTTIYKRNIFYIVCIMLCVVYMCLKYSYWEKGSRGSRFF